MPFVFTNRNGGMRWGEQSIVDKNDNLSQITATGGTVTTSGSRYIHTFTSSGTFTLSSPVTINILLVGGGGAGGGAGGSWEGSGGGGGGGVAYGTKLIPAGTYTVTVGQGGLIGSGGVPATTSADFITNAVGGNSSFTNGSIINERANGGSYGAAGCLVRTGGGGTGSGGGGGGCGGAKSGGTGSSSTAGVSSGSTSMNLTFLANSGALGSSGGGGGGGGAGGVGQSPLGASINVGGVGGQGFTWSITGSTYGGGGGGGAWRDPAGTLGGAGGTGGGGTGGTSNSGIGTPGLTNTGGGGGGGGGANGTGGAGGSGGSGVVIISYVSSSQSTSSSNNFAVNSITYGGTTQATFSASLGSGNRIVNGLNNTGSYNVYAFGNISSAGTYVINYTYSGQSTNAYILAVGGGGGGGSYGGGGAGGGGVVMLPITVNPSSGTITINIGAGGIGSVGNGGGNTNGGNTTVVFSASSGSNFVPSSITAYGGGAGGTNSNNTPGKSGGSGGGSSISTSGAAGTGNTSDNNYANNGSTVNNGGAGGGAGAVSSDNRTGGDGIKCPLTGIVDFAPPTYSSFGNYYWAGGGGGPGMNGTSKGGLGGGSGSGGGDSNGISPSTGGSGTNSSSGVGGANTGGGGGGGWNVAGGPGGSGIVVIAFPTFTSTPVSNVVTYVTTSLIINLDSTLGVSGSTWSDQTANALNYTFYNNVNLTTTNITTTTINGFQVISLNGTTNFLWRNNASGFGSNFLASFTYEMWVYPTITKNATLIYEYGQNSFSGWSDDQLGLNSGGYFTSYVYQGSAIGNGVSTSVYLANRWYHIANVYDRTANILYQYVNGSLSTQRSVSKSYPGSIWLSLCGNTGGGAYMSGAGYFQGHIGAFRGYNIALSSAQILQNYNGSKTIRYT
jgi:hypothetical protein